MKIPSESEQIRQFGEDIQKWINGELELVTRTFDVPPAPDLPAEEVKRIREDLNMSQAQFARLIHVSKRTVEGWEQGTRRPRGGDARIIDMYSKPPWRDRVRLEEPPRSGRPRTNIEVTATVKTRSRGKTVEPQNKTRTVVAAVPPSGRRKSAESGRRKAD